MKRRRVVVVFGSLDTKGSDVLFVRDLIARAGYTPVVVDTGVLGEPEFEPDVPASVVAEMGGASLNELRQKKDKTLAMRVMAEGAAMVARKLYEEGKLDAVLALGGSSGTAVGTAAMRALPLGIPKVMVSTLAAGNTAPYVGTKDVCMIHSVVDVAGVNSISAQIYSNAVGAIIGMLEMEPPKIAVRPLVVASMFGNTTKAVSYAKTILEQHGYEVLVFHATGTGGRIMESLIAEGRVVGVLDITTTELADEVVGGVLSAGPERLDAAAAAGVPQVVAPGCLDMVNFWGKDSIPEKFAGRLFYEWNPNVTLMRTTPEENTVIGKLIAEKLNRAKGPVAVFLPLRGLSMLDAPGKEFWWPEADKALFEAIKQGLRPDIPVYEIDANINDEVFAKAVAEKLLEFLGVKNRVNS